MGPGMMNFLIPVAIGVAGLTLAYAGWLAFMIVAAVLYALFGANPYYFQFVRKDDMTDEEAESAARELGQEVFPPGGTWDSLKNSSANRWTRVLVFLYTVSYGGGFTALSTWYPTY